MILTDKRLVIVLEYRGVVPIESPVGTSIECLRGRIWITEPGEADDIVLEAGQSFKTSRGGAAVVQALRKAFVGVRAPAVRRPESRLATWIARYQNLWAAIAAGEKPASC
jgi:hypothetical protein